MDREQLDGWCEKGILSLVLAILVYSPMAFGTVPQGGFDPFLVARKQEETTGTAGNPGLPH